MNQLITIPAGTQLYATAPSFIITKPTSTDILYVEDEELARFQTIKENVPMFISQLTTIEDIIVKPRTGDHKEVSAEASEVKKIAFKHYYYFLPSEYDSLYP